MIQSNPPRHFPALDGFRGLAVVLVVTSHFIAVGEMMGVHVPSGSPLDMAEFLRALGRLLHGGYLGVDCFFVLSGFLITGILLDAPKEGGRYFSVFYLRRAVRIFPLYYAVLIAVFLTRDPGPDSPWWYWLFASNLGGTYKDLFTSGQGTWLSSPAGVQLSHFWSLAVEEQFYLAWPLLVRFMSRRGLAIVCIVCLLIAPALSITLSTNTHEAAGYLFTLCRVNTLGAGALLAIVFRDPERWTRWMRRAPAVFVITGALTVVGVMFPHLYSLAPFAPLLWGSMLMLTMKAGSPIQAAMSQRWLIVLGTYSYGLYVFHFLFYPWFKEVLYDQWLAKSLGNTGWTVAVFMLVAGAITFAVSLLSWFVLEKPMLSLKRYFRY